MLGGCVKITALAAVGIAVFVAFSMLYTVFGTFPSPPILDQLQRQCNNENIGCPTSKFRFKAYQQLFVVPTSEALKWIPEDVGLFNMFGYTICAFFVVEYDYVSYNPANEQKIFEIDVLLLTGYYKKDPGVSGAWATHVFHTGPTMAKAGRQDTGLPVQMTDLKVYYSNDKNDNYCKTTKDQRIKLFVGATNKVDKVEVCLPPVSESWGGEFIPPIRNNTLPNFAGKIPKNYHEDYTAFSFDGRKDLTPFKMYLLTLDFAKVLLAKPVPQSVEGTSEGAKALRALLADNIMVVPMSMYLTEIQASCWRVLEQLGTGWALAAPLDVNKLV